MMIRKSVSFLAIAIIGIIPAFPSGGVQMTSQIRDLLEQKDKKVKQLETCEGKKKGWMIAGISTIGLTAVGVGVNIAQANKSDNLSGQIDSARHDLEVQERRLGEVNSQISEKMNAAPAAQNILGANSTSVANQNTGLRTVTATPNENARASVVRGDGVNIDGTATEFKGLDGFYGSGASEGDWSVQFPYGSVAGMSMCVSDSENVEEAYSDWNSGGRSQSGFNGENCYCVMSFPVRSEWKFLYRNTGGESGRCAQFCTQNCAHAVRYNSDFRVELFDGLNMQW